MDNLRNWDNKLLIINAIYIIILLLWNIKNINTVSLIDITLNLLGAIIFVIQFIIALLRK